MACAVQPQRPMLRRLALGSVALVTLSLFSVGACTTETIIKAAEAPDAGPAEEPDAGEDPRDAATDAAPPKPKKPLSFPHVLSRGGPTIANPKVVPIVFPGDPFKANITSFTQKIAASDYWKTQAAEYKVDRKSVV